MDDSALYGFISSLLAALSVTIPFIITWFEKRSKIEKSSQFMKLIKQRSKLTDAIQKYPNSSAVVKAKLSELLTTIDAEIEKTPGSRKIDFAPYLYFISLEILILSSVIFTKSSEFLNQTLGGESWKNGITFFEGIWSHPSTRLLLLMFCISISAGATVWVSKFLDVKIPNSKTHNLIMFACFHLIFLIFAFIGAAFLALLDPYTRLF